MTIKEIRTWYEHETGDKAEGEDYRMWLECMVSDMFKHDEQRRREEESKKLMESMRNL